MITELPSSPSLILVATPLLLICGYFLWQFLWVLSRWLLWVARRQLRYRHVPMVPYGWLPRLSSGVDSFFNQTLPRFADAQQKLPKYIDPGFFASGRNSIFIIKPDDLRFLLFDAERFPKTPETRIIIEPMLGAGLVTTEGKTWSRQRKMLTPVFHSKHLVAMLPVMEKMVFCASSDLLSADHPILHAYANPVPFFEQLTLRIILAGCFGRDLDLSEMSQRWGAVGRAFFPWIVGRFFLGPLFEKLPFKAARAMHDEVGVIKDHLRGLIRQRAAGIEREEGAVVDLLTLMMNQMDDSGAVLSEDELISQSLTIMFAGHETTSSVLSWCAFYLSMQPEIQERCFEEVRRFRSAHPGASAGLSVEMVRTQFPLLQAVFNETLRMRPPAPTISRLILQDTLLPCGLEMKRGDRAVLGIGACCLDGEYWSEPYRWNPDRWLQAGFVKPFYPVFSAGARSCIGERFARLEALVALIHLSEKFHIDLDPACRNQVVMKQVVTVQPGNLRIRLRLR